MLCVSIPLKSGLIVIILNNITIYFDKVSIPLKSGLIVILDEQWEKYKNLGLNPLEIGSNCNKIYYKTKQKI